jgi:hypothetical protein
MIDLTPPALCVNKSRVTGVQGWINCSDFVFIFLIIISLSLFRIIGDLYNL